MLGVKRCLGAEGSKPLMHPKVSPNPKPNFDLEDMELLISLSMFLEDSFHLALMALSFSTLAYSESYEFLLANKKYIVDAEVFRKILDICPRVEGEEFTPVQDDDDTLTFLTDLGYKNPLHKHTNIENVDYPELIWEDFAFQIDHRKERKSRRETMPFPRFTKEYGLAIPDMMMNDAIKQSESYKMFIKYSTCQIHSKKSRGKGSQRKKTADNPVVDVDVSNKSDSEPARKRTASRRVVKKKVTIFAADNIIPDPDIALKLGKSISLTEAAEEEAARQVHATHARIMTEFDPESAKKKTSSRSTRGVVIQDTPSDPKPKPASSKLKLEDVQSLTPEKQESADVMQALKENKKTSKRQPGTGGSTEGTSRIPGVPDESMSKCLEEYLSEEEEIDWIDSEEDDEKKYDTDDDKSIDLEMTDDEETDDEVLQGKEQVNDDEDEEMTNAEVEESGNGDEENTDAAKTDAGKTEEAKDDSKKAELPPTSSSLSVSSGFGDQFLKLYSDTSLFGTVKDTIDAEISSLLDIKIQYEVSHIQSPSVLKVPVFVISEPSVLTPLRVAKLEKDVSELKKIDHFAKALASLKSQVPTIVEQYLRSKIGDDLQKTPTINLEQESKKSASEILKIKKEQAEKQNMPKYIIKSIDKAALKEYDHKSALYQTMHENKSFNRNLDNHRLYHALMEALIEDENAMDKGVVDTGKKTKRRRTKELESLKKPSTTKETPKGKAQSKVYKTGKSASAKEPVKEPITEVVIDDDAGEDAVCDDDQPQDTLKPKTYKILSLEWFKQPLRPPTPDS
ncbi:hypothetical protein Tco_0276111 [Tanacetum coccineum]